MQYVCFGVCMCMDRYVSVCVGGGEGGRCVLVCGGIGVFWCVCVCVCGFIGL